MIKGNPYLYQVRSERNGSRVRTVFEKYLGRAKKVNISEDNMEEDLQVKELNQTAANWQTLRSEIYNRDNGMCWVCNRFVELKDYDLGHLVDRCNGGQDVYENLAVMHKQPCNVSKPKHNTLEEAIIWKLRTRYLTMERPTALFGDAPAPKAYSYPKIKSQPKTIPQAIAGDNELKLEAIRLLSQILGTPVIPNARQARPKTSQGFGFSFGHYRAGKYGRANLETRKSKTDDTPIISPPEPLPYEVIAKIVSNTICWIQGRPQGRNSTRIPMWKVLPPPYRQEDLFTIRTTPPGAADNGGHNIRETLQVIGGTLTHEIDIDLGHTHFHITPTGNGMPSITLSASDRSNNKTRGRTVGMGKGQIPLKEWYDAKAQGITFKDFVDSYPQG